MSNYNDNDRTLDLPVEDIRKEYNNSSEVVFPGDDFLDQQPKKPHKPKKPKKDRVVWHIILTVIAVIVTIAMIFELFYTTVFSALSKDLFTKLNIAVLAALLLMDIILFIAIRTKKKSFFIISLVLSILLTSLGGYAAYALTRVDTSINNLTATVKETNVTAALVVYSGNGGSPILDVQDLDGRKVGISSGSHTGEIAQTRFEQEGISPVISEYSGYTDLYTALISGEIDCAVMTTTYSILFEEDEVLSTYLEDTSSILDFSDTITTTNDDGADKDITTEPFTVLLTGENEGLADTIMVITVNPVSMKITMSSIARDSYVPITCYSGAYSKINGAHASSEQCIVSTVENLLGITIDYTVEFNFASVIQVVDAVGGIDVDITVGFDAQCWDIVNDELVVYHIDPGENVHLDGARALGYARERYAFEDGDFARQRHQQEVIRQVMEKIMATRDVNTFLNVLDAAGDNIKTNFTREQLVSFVSYSMKKAKRYYDQDNLIGVFNIQNSRVYGYNSSLWDESLQMDLYIYRLYNGSLSDTSAAIERNTNLYYSIGTSVPVDWSAAEEFTAPIISQEYYSEAIITDSGRPDTVETEEPEETEEPIEIEDPYIEVEQPEIIPDDTGSSDPSVPETPDPGVEIPVEPETGDENIGSAE